ncbi:hypothetical protein GWI33_003655 [Rhynchophorus ferrugineus]|uniref:Uncharacterized protein n=1 Tax=Rhynchophorus ferrugineus TaxID=354439 RepID=A0A834HNJ3_RHYFE|nr:hypothetical protein GWI33_003655 [Rhynchophorus ferrugineus]
MIMVLGIQYSIQWNARSDLKIGHHPMMETGSQKSGMRLDGFGTKKPGDNWLSRIFPPSTVKTGTEPVIYRCRFFRRFDVSTLHSSWRRHREPIVSGKKKQSIHATAKRLVKRTNNPKNSYGAFFLV